MAPWGRGSLECLALLLIAAITGSNCSPVNPTSKGSGRARHHIREHHVPRIIHQSWKDNNVPEGFKPWQESWKRNHPGWEYRLWTDEDNYNLIKDHYAWFLDTYESLSKPVMKADSARYLYMYHIGGVYADLDFESLRNLEDVLAGQQVVLAEMTDEDWDQAIPNAWLASEKGHPFWLFCIQQIIKAAGSCAATNTDRWDWLEATTGPVMLFHAVQAYKAVYPKAPGLNILKPGLIYPIDWRRTVWGPNDGPGDEFSVCNPPHPYFNEEGCKARFPQAYAITYWTHTW
ncbi:g4515 [Coccomyxa viridis]|uniref:G4515 protein n=1 Tax=Coccomyxa viridis TaxID=1274662 RepID=A0ABP1FVR3_9CHLO